MTLAAALALLVAGCGAAPTRHGAPPYHAPSTGAPAPDLRTRFPGVDARFSLPALAGPDLAPTRAFIAFEVAALRSFRTATVQHDLRRYASPAIRRLVGKQVALLTRFGIVRLGPYRVEIRSVDTIMGSTIRACVHDANRVRTSGGTVRDLPDKAVGEAVAVHQRRNGEWFVAAIVADRANSPSRLKHCS